MATVNTRRQPDGNGSESTDTSVEDLNMNSLESASIDSVDTLDGCDVEIVDETPDEELPPTVGGVA